MKSSKITRVFRDPRLIKIKSLRLLNRCYHRQMFTRPYNTSGVDIFEEDWDNLIILDACRYDIFNECCDMTGKLESRRSRGTTTFEFIKANFSNMTITDTVYTSANGWYKMLSDQINSKIYKFVNLHTDEFRESSGITTPPKLVTNKAKSIVKDFPNKRHIIHYLQPHSPYLGPFGQEKFKMEVDLNAIINKSKFNDGDLKKAYKENLNLVLDEVNKLLNYLDGKTVITSDHGELLGERSYPIPFKDFGHPAGIYIKELTKIPWLVMESDDRRLIESDEIEDKSKVSQENKEKIEEHLQNLGYKV